MMIMMTKAARTIGQIGLRPRLFVTVTGGGCHWHRDGILLELESRPSPGPSDTVQLTRTRTDANVKLSQ
jgi:hypothetical protein